MASGFETTVGVILIGLFFNTYLYGLVTYQFIVYHNTKFNDPFWIRAVVGFLFVMDTAHSAICVYEAWDLCVENFANPAILAVVGWEIPYTAVATSIVAMVSQFFLAYRLWRLSKNWILPVFIVVLSTIGGIAGVIAGVRSAIVWYVSGFGILAPNVIVWLGFQTGADLLLTGSLTVTFMRSRTGFQKTDTILNRLIRGAIQTGMFASIFALGDLFSFLLHRDTNLYAMFAFPIGRIYTNTLLDTLNSRSALKGELGGLARETETSDRSRQGQISSNFALGQNSIPLGGISVKTEVHADNESEASKYPVGKDREFYGP